MRCARCFAPAIVHIDASSLIFAVTMKEGASVRLKMRALRFIHTSQHTRMTKCWWPKLAQVEQTGLTRAHERSDRSGPCSRSDNPDRSDPDRSTRSPSTIRVFHGIRSVNRIPCGASPRHPINIKGHGRLRIIQSIKHKNFYLFTFSCTSFSNLLLVVPHSSLHRLRVF